MVIMADIKKNSGQIYFAAALLEFLIRDLLKRFFCYSSRYVTYTAADISTLPLVAVSAAKSAGSDAEP
jgi:hypothetical protein